ncbi:unnamed protein product [Acanthosepion pharaonis]|uniref:Uncharacterized protein n=1 Tax=Acanthosepion pharaonis TaxID=158019 RepID=A0A812D8A0_ACAPH|nr:unnamed protein product [Sepia pharaonis]
MYFFHLILFLFSPNIFSLLQFLLFLLHYLLTFKKPLIEIYSHSFQFLFSLSLASFVSSVSLLMYFSSNFFLFSPNIFSLLHIFNFINSFFPFALLSPPLPHNISHIITLFFLLSFFLTPFSPPPLFLPDSVLSSPSLSSRLRSLLTLSFFLVLLTLSFFPTPFSPHPSLSSPTPFSPHPLFLPDSVLSSSLSSRLRSLTLSFLTPLVLPSFSPLFLPDSVLSSPSLSSRLRSLLTLSFFPTPFSPHPLFLPDSVLSSPSLSSRLHFSSFTYVFSFFLFHSLYFYSFSIISFLLKIPSLFSTSFFICFDLSFYDSFILFPSLFCSFFSSSLSLSCVATF